MPPKPKNRSDQKGKHATKSLEESTEYGRIVRTARGQGATTGSPTASPDDVELESPITAQTTHVPPGNKRRIPLPQPPVESKSSHFPNWLKALIAFVGLGGIVAFAQVFKSYGSLEQLVVSNKERIEDNQEDQKSSTKKIEDIAHRITRLESQFEAAEKNGTSPIGFAKQLDELRAEFAKQRMAASNLSDRLSGLESRLMQPTTVPSPH